MEEGRKRVLGIIAGILVARHLKTTDDLFDNRSSPRTENMVAAAVQWAYRIMRRIDSLYVRPGSMSNRDFALPATLTQVNQKPISGIVGIC
jgi:hypothetical protein